MAKARMIHKGIWESKQFSRLPDKAKILYIGLITIADDEGRFKVDPQILQAKLFMWDKIRVSRISKLLLSVQEAGLIDIYSAESEKFGFHPKWNKYQKLRQDRLIKSIIPPPPTTSCQPYDNQDTAEDKIIEDKISNRKDYINNRPIGSEGMKKLEEVLKNKAPSIYNNLKR